MAVASVTDRWFSSLATQRSGTFDAGGDVVGLLAGAELDDADVRKPVLTVRIFPDDRLDLVAALADRHDDPAVARDLPSGDDEVARRVVFLQKPDVCRHLRVNRGEIGLVDQLDDEHGRSL